MVGRVSWFNVDKIPIFLRAYNVEMTKWGMEEATRMEYFCRVVAVSMHKEVKELRESHESWESLEGALLEVYGYVKPEGQGQLELDLWVASEKTHRSAMESFQEFERRFVLLSERDRRSVWVDKVLLFLKTVHQEERMDILFEIQDDQGVHGLTEEWSEVEWVC